LFSAAAHDHVVQPCTSRHAGSNGRETRSRISGGCSELCRVGDSVGGNCVVRHEGVMSKPSNEGFFWLLFSAGGVVAAIFLPVMLLLFAVAVPLGWVVPPTYDHLIALARSPLTRLFLFVVCAFPLFHWAHRFRFTLYDGLQV